MDQREISSSELKTHSRRSSASSDAKTVIESMVNELAEMKAEMDASHRNSEALGHHTDENLAKMRAILGES